MIETTVWLFTVVDGEMAERLKAVDSKSTVGATLPGVQIPLSPPGRQQTVIN